MKNGIYLFVEYALWRWCLLVARPFAKEHSGRRVVIVPCEPWTVIGSRGDEAMITAIVEAEKRADPQVEIVFLTGRPTFDGLEKFPGARIVYGWRGRILLMHVMRTLRAESPDAVYVLGADCMDGKYSVRTSQVLVGAAAYAAACGAETHLTGFSFNETPVKSLRRVFRAAARCLAPFNLRDAVSLERFERFTGAQARLVADTAFGMSPQATDVTDKWCAWCAAERAAGQIVAGINLNPMLFPKSQEENMRLMDRLAAGVRAVDPKVSFLLVPHDYRNGGDLTCLESLYGKIKERRRVAIVRDVLSAPSLKALTSGIDVLFTSRMHLAIAALGMGKPISGFAYQGKFAGLLRHFDQPDWLVGEIGEPGQIGEILDKLVSQRKELTAKVVSNLLRVHELARLNVKG